MTSALGQLMELALEADSLPPLAQEAAVVMAAGRPGLWLRLAGLANLSGGPRAAVAACRTAPVRSSYLCRADLEPAERAGLVRGEARPSVLSAAARCPHSGPELLDELAARDSWPVAMSLLGNPACPAGAVVASVATLDASWSVPAIAASLRTRKGRAMAAIAAHPRLHDALVASLTNLEAAAGLGLLRSTALSAASEDHLAAGLLEEVAARRVGREGIAFSAAEAAEIADRVAALGDRRTCRPELRRQLQRCLGSLRSLSTTAAHDRLDRIAAAVGDPGHDAVCAEATTATDAAQLSALVHAAHRDLDGELARALAANPSLAPAQIISVTGLLVPAEIAALAPARPGDAALAVCCVARGEWGPGDLGPTPEARAAVVEAMVALELGPAEARVRDQALSELAKAPGLAWQLRRLLPVAVALGPDALSAIVAGPKGRDLLVELAGELGSARAFEVFAALAGECGPQPLCDVAALSRRVAAGEPDPCPAGADQHGGEH